MHTEATLIQDRCRFVTRQKVLKVAPTIHSPNIDPFYLLLEIFQVYQYTDQQRQVVDIATIQLRYQPIHAGRKTNSAHSFEGYYHARDNTVSITNKSVILAGVERSCRVGRYLMDHVVEFVMQWPEADLEQIGVSAHDADSDNIDRRNTLYEAHGVEFVYENNEKKHGTSRPLKAKQLKRITTWRENINEYELDTYLAQCRLQEFELQSKTEAIQSNNATLEAIYAKPLRFGIATFIKLHPEKLVLAGLLLFVLLAVWIKF